MTKRGSDWYGRIHNSLVDPKNRWLKEAVEREIGGETISRIEIGNFSDEDAAKFQTAVSNACKEYVDELEYQLRLTE